MNANSRALRYRFFNPLKEGVEPGSHWVESIARIGYLAKGVVYTMVGVLAIQTAFTAARTPDTKSALEAIGDMPFGSVLLGLTAAGLACYAAWRFVEAIWDPNYKGHDAKGLATRAGYAISGFANLALAGAAATAVLWTRSDSGDKKREAAEKVLTQPGGWIALMIVGGIVVGVGIYHFYKAYTAKFMKDYEYTDMSDSERKFAKPVGQFGLTARGITFALIGLFILTAGWQGQAGEVGGLSDAFGTLAEQPWGQLLLGIVAAGFVAYGVYCLSRAKYKRFPKVT